VFAAVLRTCFSSSYSNTFLIAIYFKDRESHFIRVSRAKAERHGVADPRELIGKSDFDLFTAEHAEAALEDERRIIHTGKAIAGKVEKGNASRRANSMGAYDKNAALEPARRDHRHVRDFEGHTALKKMEEALSDSNTELGRALAELKQTHEA